MTYKTPLDGDGARVYPKLAVGVVVVLYTYFGTTLVLISHVLARGGA